MGFGLLPTALEGLGRITHLINIDTVEDLMGILRNILEVLPPAPVDVQALCIHCSLRTLAGPGQELKIDDEYLVIRLHALIKELPYSFDRWDVVLECIEMSLLHRREERNFVVVSFVRVLLLMAVQLSGSDNFLTLPCFTKGEAGDVCAEQKKTDATDDSEAQAVSIGRSFLCASSLFSVTHAVLLRYPRARQALEITQVPQERGMKPTYDKDNGDVERDGDGDGEGVTKRKKGKDEAFQPFFTEDDEVCDMAMTALKASTVGLSSTGAASSFSDYESKSEGDGSWVLALMRCHVDPLYEAAVKALSSR